MRITDFLSPAHVLLDVRASDKGRLLHQLSTQAAAEVGLDAAEVSKQIAKREALGSTGVGNGVALPHARTQRTQVAIRPAGAAAPRASTLKPSTISRSTSCSCSCCLMRLMTPSSMRWPALPVHFEAQKSLSVSVSPPIVTPFIERWLIPVALRPKRSRSASGPKRTRAGIALMAPARNPNL